MLRILVPLLLVGTVTAQVMQITGSADALYWKPTTGGFDYVRRLDQYSSIKADYHWGARGRVALTNDLLRSSLSLSGLYYRTSESATKVGERLDGGFEVGPGQSRVVGTLGYQYWNGDLRLGHTWTCTECFGAAFAAAARYADIREYQRVDGAASRGLVRQLFRGAGPGLFLGAAVSPWEGLDFHGHVGVWSLVTSRRTRLISLNRVTRFSRSTAIIPALDLELAFNYRWTLPPFCLLLEIGYDLQYYWDAIDTVPSFSALSAPWANRASSAIGFAGPYLRLGVNF